ncbi:helix-turn-helix domain-containing protein [Staphylococcus canis]|uniref:HTH domain-containing protein n=1 Tax=Staphylococcus canis TaxID=2724942 RepID=A0ABS0TD90_9STAP|nr:HTH domain-containing protein [Staphylococcus canis]MBI5975709.1 HTH domain-containing protein [Staphylococcus canis]
MLSHRQYEILEKIIRNEDYISVVDLAHEFDLTERTIQYDLEYIELMKDKLELEIDRNKRQGIKIISHNDDLLKKEKSTVFCTAPQKLNLQNSTFGVFNYE